MSHDHKSDPKIFYLETSIFPLLNVKEKIGGNPSTVEYKGTCFLITIGQQHIFITARHLLEKPLEKHNIYLGYNASNGQPSLLKVAAAFVYHLGQDISFFLPTVQMKNEYNNVFIPMKALKCSLPIGQKVLVYGFPNSGQQGNKKGIPIVNIQRNRYEGKVVGFDHDCPHPKMKSIYLLDIPSPYGLCGSPVIVVHNNAVAVAGYIIGERTTIIDEKANNNKSYATATDYAPFTEIEKLLTDVSRRLGNK